jgi:alkanesulfonate monooxygenase SsuD/methylene tetrahydromethanopterin reductase-like flavin-dependent oxidoreductase (luciferase family)
MKKIGFLSFGHWGRFPGSQTPTAADTLLQSIDLAQAMEDIGADGAFVRVHHFAPQLSSPFPLLAAMGAKTSKVAIGTGVIDMRYENPLYMAEEAASADLISGGRLQLGVSRGSPEPALNGAGAFGYQSPEGWPEGEYPRRKTALFREAIKGAPVAEADPKQGYGSGMGLKVQPQSPDLYKRIWWGAGTRETAAWAAKEGYNLMSSTLLTETNGKEFHNLQAEQIRIFREGWATWQHDFEPQVSVSRSILPITSDEDAAYFGEADTQGDQVGVIDNRLSTFGRTYQGDVERIVRELKKDTAVEAADWLLVTIPNQLGVAYNTRLMETIVRDVAPELNWR